jgi:hypothetical protein
LPRRRGINAFRHRATTTLTLKSDFDIEISLTLHLAGLALAPFQNGDLSACLEPVRAFLVIHAVIPLLQIVTVASLFTSAFQPGRPIDVIQVPIQFVSPGRSARPVGKLVLAD